MPPQLPPSSARSGLRWIKCPRCSGDVGVPASCQANSIACPKCATAVAINGVPHVRWQIHIACLTGIFVVLVALINAIVMSARTREEADLYLNISIAIPLLALALVSIICWLIVLITLIKNDQTLLATILLVSLPFGYLFTFLYGWGKTHWLPVVEAMLIWTYCIAIALQVAAATTSGYFLEEHLFPWTSNW